MKATVTKIIQEAVDIKTLVITLPEPIEYEAGQFLVIVQEMPKEDGSMEKIRRPYSFSSYAAEQPTNEVTVTFNIVPNGKMSTFLYGLEEGAELEVLAPYGIFTLEKNVQEFIFIAAGVGVTPMMSMIDEGLAKGHQMSLVYSAKNPESMAFKEKLEALAQEEKLTFLPTMTREGKEPWSGPRGRIDASLMKQAIKTGKEHAYICGPPEFIDAMAQLLFAEGFEKPQIHIEKWD